MATINFFLQSKKSPAGIYVRLREGRKVDAKAKTKFVINPSDWSSNKGQPKNLKDANLKKLNIDLEEFKYNLLNHYNRCVSNSCIDSNWLKEFINPSPQAEEIPTKLVAYFGYYSRGKKNDITPSSHTKINVNKKLIERFQTDQKKEFYIKDVNAAFKIAFETYCKKELYSQNTIARAVKFIKTICYHAQTNGIETHHQLSSISSKTEKVEKIYLDLKELELIEKADLKTDYLQNARDWLLISCETGQRVSDFLKFTKEQIRIEDEETLIEFTQSKTHKLMAMKLSTKVKNILERRESNFPRRISDQKYNIYIKEVCKIAGLTENISGSKMNKEIKRKVKGIYPKYELVASHIGRRSFATNNYGRVPTSLLIGATGHSTEKQFLEYIGKTDTQKAMQLAKYIL